MKSPFLGLRSDIVTYIPDNAYGIECKLNFSQVFGGYPMHWDVNNKIMSFSPIKPFLWFVHKVINFKNAIATQKINFQSCLHIGGLKGLP